MPMNSKTIKINSSEVKIIAPIIKKEATLYIPISELGNVYNIEIDTINNSIVTVDSLDREFIKADIIKNTNVKYNTKLISKTVDKLKEGDKVVWISEKNGWARIRTQNGKIGYIKSDRITNKTTVREKMEPKKQIEGKINLVWDYYSEYVDAPDRTGTTIEGINVVSPSFFSLDKGDTVKIIDNAARGGQNYIKWAKQKRPEDYIILKKPQKQGGYDMKKERMSILNMLEKGIITAQEAERLLLALNGTAKTPEREGVNDVVNQALNKAGSAINTFAKAVGQQAEKLEPKVKNVAEKVTEKACVIADDAKTYADKLREKRAKAKEEKQQDMDNVDDTDDMECTEYTDYEEQPQTEETVYEEQQQENKKGVVTKLFSNLTDKAELIQGHVKEKASETKEFIGKVKELREDMKKEKAVCEQEQNTEPEQSEEQLEEKQNNYLKKVDKSMENIQSQLQQIDDMESFLKNTFGEDANWEEEDEEEEKKRQV